ncbi:MAG: hypothetical protein KDA85_14100 [Planctomycetaceae bacterium]|nr:hypothetical protein [Planctomycetaceae bacterium]
MVRNYSFPRVKRGDTVYCVEWKKNKPTVVEFPVASAAHSSIVVLEPNGTEKILVGKQTLSRYAASNGDAVAKEFLRLAKQAQADEANAINVLKQVIALGALL